MQSAIRFLAPLIFTSGLAVTGGLIVTSDFVAAQTRSPQTQGPSNDIASAKIAKMSPRKFKRLTVPGDVVETNVERLTTRMRWHKRLGAALAEGKAKGKPVVWIQALGDLEGFL